MSRCFVEVLRDPQWERTRNNGISCEKGRYLIMDDALKDNLKLQMETRCPETEQQNIRLLQTTNEAYDILSSSKYVAVWRKLIVISVAKLSIVSGLQN